MSNNGLKKMMVIALLLMIIIGQSGLTFAADTPTTSALVITTQDDQVYNLTEDGHVNFSVITTHNNPMTITWNQIPSDDLKLTQTGILKTSKKVGRVTTYYQEAKYLFTPVNIDEQTTYVYTISSTSASNPSDYDDIKVTFVVSPVIAPENRAPIAVNDSYSIELGKTLVFNPLVNDSDPDGNVLTLTSVTGVGNLSFSGSVVNFVPSDSQVNSDVTFSYTISDNALIATGSITIHVTPIVVNDPFVYVALGDSIPSGVSYEGSLTAKNIESYSDKLAIQFDNANNQFEYFDYAVSGYNAIDVFLQVNNPTYQNAISRADVITLCVGANDIMDAAKRNWTGSINFYSIDWAKAEVGRIAFETYWPQIIRKIQTLNSDVDLIVSTIYNPYNKNDSKSYNKIAGQNTSLLIHDQVDLYLWNNTTSKLGLNTIILNYKSAPMLSLKYIVVNVHELFESNYLNSKGSVTGFYGNWVQDPHPDPNGQTIIYNLHKSVYAMQ